MTHWEQFKLDLPKILNITVAYLLISWFIVFYNQALLHSKLSLGHTDLNNLSLILLISTLFGIFSGFVGGLILIYINRSFFRTKSMGYVLLFTFFVFSLIYFAINLLGSMALISSSMPSAPLSILIAEAFKFEMYDMAVLSNYLLWGVVVLMTIFLLQVNDKFGPGIMINFLKGKYHHPKTNRRLFMFLDLKSSTTIAEKMANEKYFIFLREVFSDVTPTILKNRGEIYQYVGDEIVITWEITDKLVPDHVINCFFEIKAELLSLKEKYQEEFGVQPEFKAGLHAGDVIAGEIGSIKKDIVYSGDVLNTTARIQELCNHYRTDFILSEKVKELFDHMPIELMDIGMIDLRGKEEKVRLYSYV